MAFTPIENPAYPQGAGKISRPNGRVIDKYCVRGTAKRSMNVQNANAKPISFLLTAIVVGLVNVSSLCAEKKSWKDETVLISRKGDQTVVQPFEGDKILFKNADPQLAIEWGMANARTTVVLAGKYVLSDVIDIPRDAVTLIIDQGAEILLNPKTKHTPITPGFRGRNGKRYPTTAVIYVKGRSNVRVICFGTALGGTFPVMFDGRNEKRTCGIKGGMLLLAGSANNSCWLIDSRGVHVPFLGVDSGLDAVLAMEGCEECKLGTIVNLAPKPGGKTGEVVDLNGSCRRITIERLIGERSQEIIDMNGSHADVKELISVGEPRKLLCFVVGAGRRFTSRPTCADRLDVWKATVLADATSSALRVEVPKLPDALPRFTVKAIVEVTMKDGSKKQYTKEVVIDVRTGGVKGEKTK